jgi:exonuclease III
MRVCFWNIRGLGGKERRQLRKMIFKQRIDVICLQEIMKTHFSLANLRNLVGAEVLLELDLCKGGILGGL